MARTKVPQSLAPVEIRSIRFGDLETVVRVRTSKGAGELRFKLALDRFYGDAYQLSGVSWELQGAKEDSGWATFLAYVRESIEAEEIARAV